MIFNISEEFMKKRWYIFIILVLSVFFIVLVQPLTYSLDNSCPDNLELVKLGDQPVFCVSDKGRAEIIGKRLEKIAENGSLRTDVFIFNSQNKTLGIPYILITLNERDKVAVVENNSVKWKDILPRFDTGGSNSKIQQNIELTNIIDLAIKNHAKKTQESNHNLNLGLILEALGLLFLLVLYFRWMNQQDWFIQHQIPSMIILLGLLCLASVGGVLIFFDNFFEYLGLILPVFLGIIGGFYASLKSVEATQESIKTAKIEKALEYINKWDSTELQTPRRETADFVHQINTTAHAISAIMAAIPDHPNPPTQDDIRNAVRNNAPGISAVMGRAIEEAIGEAFTRSGSTQVVDGVGRVVEYSILREMNTVIPAKTQIRFDLRIICNFWEKIYILLDNNLADKSILSEAFRDLYQQKYYQVCTKFLVYLSSREGEPNTAMSTHLNNLRNDETWQ
ncbi:MAG: hypothetical protein DWQ54_14135 [Microcystis flos-aquae TF09]|jgi:hypothetical protein|uniref:Uncharacterized protein n=1 Tax=Microcystis flos-aquae TF09 TaxID=2060473 RepID=A0A3E0L3G2_9CHRO|nr:MAG: hypothetical protein DWQ54_14135 [Microcystis flos-aquae TF09]